MLKLLVKKQLTEIFRAYYYDAKKNKARSKASTLMLMLWFILLIVGLLGGIFTFLSIKLCVPMAGADVAWMYFALMGLLAVFLGTFGSVFNTYSSLYLAKDNDLLLSMPIPVSILMASRLLSVYLMGLIYSGIVIVPAVVVYWVTAGITVQGVLGGILMTVLISVFVMVLSCALGWVVAKVSRKLRHKSLITVFVSLAFIFVYYFFYFKAQSMIQELLVHLDVYGSRLKASAYLLYLFGCVGVGDGKASVIMALAVGALAVLVWLLLSHSFLEVATSAGGVSRTVYREKAVKCRDVSTALLDRELRHFTSSPNYMLNCGMGLFLIPIGAVLILWKGREVFEMLNQLFEGYDGCTPLLFAVAMCGIASMNLMTAPSVSLEGKSLWLAQSLPVTPWQVLGAKIKMQVLLTAPPVLLCIICAALVSPLKAVEIFLLVLHALSYAFLLAVFGLFCGVNKPVLTWTNEIVPIKQSAPVAVTMLGGFGYALVMFAGYVMLPGWALGYVPYMSIFIVINAALGIMLYTWLKTKGSLKFAAL